MKHNKEIKINVAVDTNGKNCGNCDYVIEIDDRCGLFNCYISVDPDEPNWLKLGFVGYLNYIRCKQCKEEFIDKE